MKPFTYERARSPAAAAQAAARTQGTKFIAGGTNLLDAIYNADILGCNLRPGCACISSPTSMRAGSARCARRLTASSVMAW